LRACALATTMGREKHNCRSFTRASMQLVLISCLHALQDRKRCSHQGGCALRKVQPRFGKPFSGQRLPDHGKLHDACYCSSLHITNYRRFLLGGYVKLILIAMQPKSLLCFAPVLNEGPIDLVLMCESEYCFNTPAHHGSDRRKDNPYIASLAIYHVLPFQPPHSMETMEIFAKHRQYIVLPPSKRSD
jgi:hypothetical protein